MDHNCKQLFNWPAHSQAFRYLLPPEFFFSLGFLGQRGDSYFSTPICKEILALIAIAMQNNIKDMSIEHDLYIVWHNEAALIMFYDKTPHDANDCF